MMPRPALISVCLAVVLIGWGFSWEVLRFQTGAAPLPEATVPVFYRFFFAALLFISFIVGRDLMRGQISFAWPLRIWAWVAALVLGFFSTNYSLYYYGQVGLPPGLVSLLFASIVVTNLIVVAIATRQWPNVQTTLAALVGLTGLIGVLWPGLALGDGQALDWAFATQAGLCFLGTCVVSLATLVQVRLNTFGVPVVSSTAFAMAFGASYVGLFSFLRGYSFDITGLAPSFYGSLAFLVLFGSIGAFSAYLKLVGLIGPNRGAYVNLASAVIALIVSYIVGTSGPWGWMQYAGVVLIVLGYVAVLAQRAEPALADPPPAFSDDETP